MKIQHILRIGLLTICILLTSQVCAVDLVSDSVITNNVKANILKDKSLSAFKVNIKTMNGVVSLSGTVNSDTDASAYIQLAQATENVKDVDASNLTVKDSTQPFTDMVITAKVKGVLIREKLLGQDIVAVGLHIETNDGVVYLSGNVDNQQIADNVIKLVKSINGVSKVESRMKVVKPQ